MAGRSKAEPSAAGTQCSIIMPFGTYTTASRRTGRAAVVRSAANAGTMPSSRGRASEAPSPRRTVRRGNAFRVTNMGRPPVCDEPPCRIPGFDAPVTPPGVQATAIRGGRVAGRMQRGLAMGSYVNRSRTATLKSKNTGAPSRVLGSGNTAAGLAGRCTVTDRVAGSTTQTSRVPARSQSSTLA